MNNVTSRSLTNTPPTLMVVKCPQRIRAQVFHKLHPLISEINMGVKNGLYTRVYEQSNIINWVFLAQQKTAFYSSKSSFLILWQSVVKNGLRWDVSLGFLSILNCEDQRRITMALHYGAISKQPSLHAATLFFCPQKDSFYLKKILLRVFIFIKQKHNSSKIQHRF